MTHGPGAPSLSTDHPRVMSGRPRVTRAPLMAPVTTEPVVTPWGLTRLMAPAPETLMVSSHDVMLAAPRPGLD